MCTPQLGSLKGSITEGNLDMDVATLLAPYVKHRVCFSEVAEVIISSCHGTDLLNKKKNRNLFSMLYPEDTDSQVFREVGKYLRTHVTCIALQLDERQCENVKSGKDVKVGWNGSVIIKGQHDQSHVIKYLRP